MTQSCQQILLEGPGLLVLDEGHFPCNKDTNILHALSQIHTRRRVLFSGTLFQNNFKELFNILTLVRPNILDLNSFQAFFSRLISIITAIERHPKLIYRGHVQDTVERIRFPLFSLLTIPLNFVKVPSTYAISLKLAYVLKISQISSIVMFSNLRASHCRFDLQICLCR